MALIDCPECGREVSNRAPTCPQCGAPIATPSTSTPTVDPRGAGGNVVAGIASFFIPGLGQLVQGRIGAAFVHFVLTMFLWIVLLGWIVHIASAIDAGRWSPSKR